MNKTQIITVAVMAVFVAVMFAAPIALNSADSAFAAPHHHPHPCHHLGQKHCFPPCHHIHTHPPRVICPRH
jgi:hypothetical protein